MGWDLLAGKIAARRKLMQLLWTSKSQVIRLEESSLYGNKSDEVFFIFHFSKYALWVLIIKRITRWNSAENFDLIF